MGNANQWDDPTMVGKPWQYLGGITCRPASAARYWAEEITVAPNYTMQRCAVIGQGAGVGQQACACALNTSSYTTVVKPCCTTMGLGCLAPVPGYIADNLVLSEDQAKALNSFDEYVENTGCGDYAVGEETWQSEYARQQSKALFFRAFRADVDPRKPPYSPVDAQEFQAGMNNIATTPAGNDVPDFYMSPVMGGDGTRFKGVGKNSKMFSNELSTGNPAYQHLTLFITQVYRATRVFMVDTLMNRGVRVNRFEPDKHFLDQGHTADPPGDVDNAVVGAGVPYSGVTDVTYTTGVPSFVSFPLFLNGDPDLRDQSTNCTTDPGNCAGVRMTHDGKAAVPSEAAHMTYLEVEPASGMTVSAKKRLAASFSIFKCLNPAGEDSLPAYKLGCFPGFASASMANLLSPNIAGGKIAMMYWIEETAAATDKQMSDIVKVGKLARSADLLLVICPIIGSIITLIATVVLFSKRNEASRKSRADGLDSSLLTETLERVAFSSDSDREPSRLR